VIKESGELALSWVKNYAYDLCITNRRSEDPLKVPEPIDIHLHLPAGATKKDGPSAGVAMVRSFVALSPQLPLGSRWCRILISSFILDLCIRVSPNGRLRTHQHRHDGRGKRIHESLKF